MHYHWDGHLRERLVPKQYGWTGRALRRNRDLLVIRKTLMKIPSTPILHFTVTGIDKWCCKCWTISYTLHGDNISWAPKDPFYKWVSGEGNTDTFGLGHPQLMLISSKPFLSRIWAAFNILCLLLPPNCATIGCSDLSNLLAYNALSKKCLL